MSIKKIGETNPVIKHGEFSLWMFDDIGPVLVTKEEFFPDRCEECGNDQEEKAYVALRFRLSLSGVHMSIGPQFLHSDNNEKKRDDLFDSLTEEKVREILKPALEVLSTYRERGVFLGPDCPGCGAPATVIKEDIKEDIFQVSFDCGASAVSEHGKSEFLVSKECPKNPTEFIDKIKDYKVLDARTYTEEENKT